MELAQSMIMMTQTHMTTRPMPRRTFRCSKGMHPSGQVTLMMCGSVTWGTSSTVGLDFALLRLPLGKGWAVRHSPDAVSGATTMQAAVTRFDRALGLALGRMFNGLCS